MRVIKMLLILGLCAGLLPSPAGGQSKVRRPWVDDLGLMDSERELAARVDAWTTAAKQGHAEAQNYLGYAYASGHGVPKNYAEAMRWYRLAADQGNAEAQYNLGVIYYNGEGVPQDFAEAVRWYRLAADQGNARAQVNLGVMYKWGYGVPKDYVFAHMWFNLAAAGGVEYVRTARDELVKEMTPKQITEAQRMAREWFEKRKGK